MYSGSSFTSSLSVRYTVKKAPPFVRYSVALTSFPSSSSHGTLTATFTAVSVSYDFPSMTRRMINPQVLIIGCNHRDIIVICWCQLDDREPRRVGGRPWLPRTLP